MSVAALSGPTLRPYRNLVTILSLAGFLLFAILLSAGKGAVPIAPGAFFAILGNFVGLELPWAFTPREQTVLLAIRLPRVCLGILTGAGLALAGATLQGLFRNPLADPALIGVSSGAALAAVSVIVFGGGAAAALPFLPQTWLLPLAAFAGGLGCTALVYRIANRGGRTDIPTMLLCGVAVNAIANAGMGLLIFLSDDQQLRDLNFWLLGSLGSVTWDKLLPVIPLAGLAILLLPGFARFLNAMLLGEAEAHHLGYDVEREKRLAVLLAALATGAAVAVSGIIGFVGLVVPHLIRLLIGPNHVTLLPASAMLGAALMLIADLVSRHIVLPAELPIGIVTACVGGPFFLWLLWRRRGIGGW
ncbi:MAG: iron chelate uptake ABC transporter family permease subunit [Alphaproteobacteria bacterium]